MSGLAAVWHRDGRPADGDSLQLLFPAPGRGRPVEPAVWAENSVALGYAAGPTPAALAHDAASGLTVVFEGRIDNAGDLRAAVGAAAGHAQDDASLALAAYRAWQSSAFARISGDFAIVIWDAPARRLVAARDILGMRPLAAHVSDDVVRCGSDVGALARSVDAAIDERTVADALCGRPASLTRTLYSGVTRIRPAHYLVVDPSRHSTAPYWTPDTAGERRYAGADDYVDETRHRLDVAVRACADDPSGRPVAIMLSGGLDSGAVYATAEAQGRRLRAFTLASREAALDETAAAQAVVARAGGRDWAAVDADVRAYGFEAEIADTGELPTYPTGAASHLLRQAASAAGARVLLNGVGGDEWFFGSCADLADHLRRGAWRTLAGRWREEMALSDPVGRGMLLQSAVWPLVPRPLKRVVRFARGMSPPPPWVSPTLAREVARPEPNWPDLPDAGSHAAAHLIADAWAAEAVASREEQARFAARHGLDDRSPWHHRGIVDFALGVPEAIRRLGGVPKGLVRHTMADRLPARTVSGVAYGDHAHLVLEALARVGSRRLVTHPTIAARGWVRPAEVGALHDRLDAAVAAGDPRWPDFAHALWQVVAVELWHRALSGVDVRSADP